MSTSYVVLLKRLVDDEDEHSDKIDAYIPWGAARVANNAEQACRQVAAGFTDAEIGAGVTLIAVPQRNWASGRNTFAAKTERKLIRS